MTKGDFILGIITSLIASMLFELWRNGYLLLKQLTIKTYSGLSIKTVLPITLFVIALFTLANPPSTVIAPTESLRWETIVKSKDKTIRLPHTLKEGSEIAVSNTGAVYVISVEGLR